LAIENLKSKIENRKGFSVYGCRLVIIRQKAKVENRKSKISAWHCFSVYALAAKKTGPIPALSE
jgi:hypothetical protein